LSLFNLTYFCVAEAGWSEQDSVSTTSLIDVVLFLSLPLTIGLLVYLALQRTAEILIGGIRFSIRDLLLLCLYAALLIACLSLFYRRFGDV